MKEWTEGLLLADGYKLQNAEITNVSLNFRDHGVLSLAVERQYRKDNERKADFINCVALGKNGEFAEKYLHKGMKIAVIGSWQTGNYTDTDGKKIYTNDCLVETHEFVESKGRSNQSENIGTVPPPAPASDTFVEPAYDPDLPFS